MQIVGALKEKLDGGNDFGDALLRTCDIWANVLPGTWHMALQEGFHERLRAAGCADEVAYVLAWLRLFFASGAPVAAGETAW